MLSANNYGFGAKLLHHLALGTEFMGEASLDLELGIHGKKLSDNHAAHHVFVAGLARAGTTLLMRQLYQSGEFCSLTYRDMPFVLAPNLWSKISRSSQKKMAALERAHGDGILVDYDSPEALEEVFWRMTSKNKYILTDTLTPMSADEETIRRFRRYIDLVILRYKGQRYLSKNNNNILRLSSISRAFPNATILVPFREPVQHAQSLLKQHRKFCVEQKDDRFIKQYMTWLGHHEFGLDHRPFDFFSNNSMPQQPPDSIEYWLQRWIDAYQYILDEFKSGKAKCVFFGYERFCDDPVNIRHKLMKIVGVTNYKSEELILKKSIDGIARSDDMELYKGAMKIYENLSEQSGQQLSTTDPG